MKKIIYSLIAGVMGLFGLLAPLSAAPVYAADGRACTCKNGEPGTMYDGAILKDICDCGHGEGIKEILSIVVRVMTVGVGILATIGVVVAGVQYLTAGGNEEQTRKSKRRIFEIVIGVVAYILTFALLNWLIPGFEPFF